MSGFSAIDGPTKTLQKNQLILLSTFVVFVKSVSDKSSWVKIISVILPTENV